MPESNQPSLVRKIRPYLILIVVSALVLWKFGRRFKESYFPTADTTLSATSKIRRIGNFEVYDNCQWIDDKSNDGDSFLVQQGKSKYTFRLYFVDAPETSLSEDHKDQAAEQGEYFGDLSPDQTVEIGLKAKAFTEKQLKGKTFTILTSWQNVFNSDRYYAVVWLPGSTEDRPIKLSDELIKNGLARIYNEGPWNRSAGNYNQFEDPNEIKQKRQGYNRRLLKLEEQAKQAEAGAWGAK